MLEREKLFLGAALAGQEARLARALRAERRAAASGRNYDVMRHLTLARLCSGGSLRALPSRHTSEPEITPGNKKTGE